jgi:FixJ family two-component response regulator
MGMGARTVAVVDDDDSVRCSLARLLKSAGFDVHLFPSADEFIRYAASARSGCVIIDVQMPKMGGLELQAFCAKHLPSTPIIMITAFHDLVAETSALEAGALAFFIKPFDAGALVETVKTALGGAP